MAPKNKPTPPPPTPKKPSPFAESKNVKAALRIAGSDGNITRGEANQISKQFKVDDTRIVKATDKLNAGLRERGKDLQIGLGSNYVNQIIKNQPTGWAFDKLMGKSIYGDGAIGQSVAKYRDSAYTLKPGEGMVMGNWDARARAQSAAGLIPLQRGGAYQINAAGGYSPKVSNAAFGQGTKTVVSNTYADPLGSDRPTNTATTDPITPEPELPDPLPTDAGAGMMAGGGAGAAGATNLRRAKSRLRQLGIYGRGTSLLGRGLQYGNALNT